MSETYDHTRGRLEAYFDGTANEAWQRLMSDAPVSRIRQTVREGRDRMRAELLAALPRDLDGARVLDAGCGIGQLSVELAARGAHVVAVDISPKLLDVARKQTPEILQGRIDYVSGDMLEPAWGHFTYALAMDSLIHYAPEDIAKALAALSARVSQSVVFTVAPRTPLLSAMHLAGKLFPRSDRSPAIIPVTPARLERELAPLGSFRLRSGARVNSGFYISQAMEVRGQ